MATTPIKQVPSLVLPTVWTTGAETETVADVLEHTSTEFLVESLQEKEFQILATEVALAPAAVPGNLWLWVELSPVSSTTSTNYWAAIGGGGGALAPTAPVVEGSALGGAAGALIHTLLIPWVMHSVWARIVVQTPVAAALPNAYWLVQCIITGKY